MEKLYVVELLVDQRRRLRDLIKENGWSARLRTRASILLHADGGATDAAIAAAAHCGVATVQRIRKRYVVDGFEAAMNERPRPGGTRKLDGKQEALLVALTCSTPPEDRVTWTMQLLADRLITLKVVETISDETVRRMLKKTT